MMGSATLEDMEKAACCLLQIIKDTPELKGIKIAIAGDIAVRKYLGDARQQGVARSGSIDLITNSTTSASLLRKKLLQHPMTPLTVSSEQLLYYKASCSSSSSSLSSSSASSSSSRPTTSSSSASPRIEIRITPEMFCPYLPSAATLVHDLKATTPDSSLPYISLPDLIVFKMDACGLRDSPQGKQAEARDAADLLEVAAKHCALDLNPAQLRVVDECLSDILRHSLPANQSGSKGTDRQNKAWWQARLTGKCDPDARKEAKDVLSDMLESMNVSDGGNHSGGGSETTTPSSNKRWSPGFPSRSSTVSSKSSASSSTSSSASSASSMDSYTSGCFGNFTTSPTATSPPSSTSSSALSSPLESTRPCSSPKDPQLTCAVPSSTRPRKFSTSGNHSPTKASHSHSHSHARKKTADYGRPRRHSQILGYQNGGDNNNNNNNSNNNYNGHRNMDSPGLTLTGRFESTPGVDSNLYSSNTGSYF